MSDCMALDSAGTLSTQNAPNPFPVGIKVIPAGQLGTSAKADATTPPVEGATADTEATADEPTWILMSGILPQPTSEQPTIRINILFVMIQAYAALVRRTIVSYRTQS
jgi:hypothetical protein